VISIISAHRPERHKFLADCYESLRDQPGAWEWIIEIDGPLYQLASNISDDPRVSVDYTGARLGAAAARNFALSRATGKFIFSLDDDDILYPDCLSSLAGALEKSQLPAAIGNAYRLSGPDQPLLAWQSHGYESDTLYRRGEDIPAGAVEANKDSYGTHCLASCSVFWRHEYLLSLGGWPAITGSEDSALLARANASSAILHPDIDVLIYREHPEQESADENILRLRRRSWPLIKKMLEDG